MRLRSMMIHRLLGDALYWDESIFLLRGDKTKIQVDLDQIKSARVVVLGKCWYFETTAAFPMGSLKEIRAAVAMDQETYAPFGGGVFFLRRIGQQDSKTLVNMWFVRPDILQDLNRLSPWMVFPETALWSSIRQMESALYVIRRSMDYLLVHVGKDRSVRSTLARNDTTDVVAFHRCLGWEVDRPGDIPIDSFDDYLIGLQNCYQALPLADLAPFFRGRVPVGGHMNVSMLKWGLLPLLLMGFIYLGVISALPVYMEKKLLMENEALSIRLGDILTKQSRIEELTTDVNLLIGVLNSYTPRTLLFDHMHRILPEETRINQMTLSTGRIEIRGSAILGSQVVSSLTSSPGFVDVKLAAPLRKDNKTGRDLFTISFVYVIPDTTGNESEASASD